MIKVLIIILEYEEITILNNFNDIESSDEENFAEFKVRPRGSDHPLMEASWINSDVLKSQVYM